MHNNETKPQQQFNMWGEKVLVAGSVSLLTDFEDDTRNPVGAREVTSATCQPRLGRCLRQQSAQQLLPPILLLPASWLPG